MNLLLVGYGKMGKLVEQLAVEQGDSIAGRVDLDGQGWIRADVAVDFSTADALAGNFARYVELGLPRNTLRPCEPKPPACGSAWWRRQIFRSGSTCSS